MGPGNMQGGGQGYSGGPGMMGGPGTSNTKMAIHQMISNRSRMPGPSGGQFVGQGGGGMGGPGGMMRPSGQYGGNMMPT